MAKDIVLFSNKKDAYPTKKTINLYYKEDKSSGISTFTLYLLFIVVVLMALSKMFVFDVISDLNKAEKEYKKLQGTLDSYVGALAEYDKVNTEYNKYSYNYLSEQEKIKDRMDVLAMLEATVFTQSTVESVSVSGDVISLSLTDIELDETAVLAKTIEKYDIVDAVVVNTASFGGTYTTRMVITLTIEGEVGGEQ